MLELVRAPAIIGLHPKSHFLMNEEEKAVTDAIRASRYVDVPLPVMFKKEQLGWVLGHQLTPDVLYLPQRRSLDRVVAAGFPNYDSIISAITVSGRRYSAQWSKGATTAPVALNWYDLWAVAGNPVSGVYTGTASTSRQFTDTSTGTIPCFGNVSTLTKHLMYIWGMASAGATQPTLVLYDRVADYPAVPFNNNAANTFTQSNSPTGLRYNTNGDGGCKVMVTGQTVTGATQQFVSAMTYTDSDGNTAQAMPAGSATTTSIIVSAAAPTATLGARVISPALTAAATSLPNWFMPLATGDVGVQQITSMTNNAVAANSGTMNWAMVRALAILPLGTLGVVSEKDLVMMTAAMERVFDGAALSFLVYFPVATGCTFTGGFDVAWN